MGLVLNRAEISKDLQLVISRKQFDPLPEPHKIWYENARREIAEAVADYSTSMQRPYITQPKFEITWEDMSTICYPILPADSDPSRVIAALSENVTYNYIRLVCSYVNQVRNAARNQQLAEDAAQTGAVPIRDDSSSCVVIRDRVIKQMVASGTESESAAVARLLNAMNMTRTSFQSHDYLFIPYIAAQAHYVLLGFAPQQRFAFIMDSVDGKFSYPMRVLQHILFYMDPKTKWNIFGQWSRRLRTTDKSPNCCQQKDLYNCGNFVMTNAFCLAFGPADRVGKSQPAAKYRPRGPSIFEDRDEVAYGFDNSEKKRKYDVQYPFGEPRRIRTATQALAYEQQLPLEERPQPRTPDPYPPQFDPKFFNQCGFLYETPASINYNPARDYSLNELTAACRNFPLEGWEEWAIEPKEILTKWMLNEMAAFLSLARGDPLEPMDDLEKGFIFFMPYLRVILVSDYSSLGM
ncbi:hypothetical protein V8E51_010993 [Hyaloscypha variabilis]